MFNTNQVLHLFVYLSIVSIISVTKYYIAMAKYAYFYVF